MQDLSEWAFAGVIQPLFLAVSSALFFRSSKISCKTYVVMGMRAAKSGLERSDKNDILHLKEAWHNAKKKKKKKHK